jgi:hypothetical protein
MRLFHLHHPGETCSSHRHALLSICSPAAVFDRGRKPSSDSPPLASPMVQIQTWSKVTSNHSYRLCPCNFAWALHLMIVSSADRPCATFEFLRHHHHHHHHHRRHHPSRARTLYDLYLCPCHAISPPTIEHPPSVCVRHRQRRGPNTRDCCITTSQHFTKAP